MRHGNHALTVEEWNLLLGTSKGAEIVSVFACFRDLTPALGPPVRGAERKAWRSLIALGCPSRPVRLLAPARLERELSALRARVPIKVGARLAQVLWDGLWDRLEAVPWQDMALAVEVEGKLSGGVASSPWAAARHGVARELEGTLWGRLGYQVPGQGQSAVGELVQEAFEGILTAHVAWLVSDAANAEARRTATRELVGLYKEGNFPAGVFRSDENRKGLLVLVG